MGTSKIEWTDATWSPVIGCTKCSPGCLNCYAERMARRLAYMGQKKYRAVLDSRYDKPPWNNEVFCDESVLDKPLHWRKPRRIFVCSMSDLFHEAVPFEFINSIFGIIVLCPQHTFLLLTKRIKRAVEISATLPDNAHLGVSISTQAEADEKIPIGLQIPSFDWVSVEPMLERIKLSPTVFGYTKPTGQFRTHKNKRQVAFGYNPKAPKLGWVVIGAESLGGRPGRECKFEWIRDLVGQCKAAGVPVFVKQIHLNGKLVKDITKFPKDLRHRDYPKGAVK